MSDFGNCTLREACHPNGPSPLVYLECCDAWACPACLEAHLREDPERAHAVGSEAILWAQGYLCAIVVQGAYHKASVRGKGLKAVDAIVTNIENGIKTAFPEDIAQEILHMKAIRMMKNV